MNAGYFVFFDSVPDAAAVAGCGWIKLELLASKERDDIVWIVYTKHGGYQHKAEDTTCRGNDVVDDVTAPSDRNGCYCIIVIHTPSSLCGQESAKSLFYFGMGRMRGNSPQIDTGIANKQQEQQ